MDFVQYGGHTAVVPAVGAAVLAVACLDWCVTHLASGSDGTSPVRSYAPPSFFFMAVS